MPTVRSFFERGGDRFVFNTAGPDSGSVGGPLGQEYVGAVPTGAELQLTAFDEVDQTGDVRLVSPDGRTVNDLPDYRGGQYRQNISAPSEPGTYQLTVGNQTVEIIRVGSGDGVTRSQAFGEHEQRNQTPGDDEPDIGQLPGVVNADNDEGAALAPSLRRSIGNVGGSVTIGGDPLEVGPVTDDDERLADGGGAGGGLLGGIGILAALAAVVWVVMG